jgi:hypothetical protein
MSTLIIPAYQPVPFPAPFWLLEILIVLGFFLHALPMNIIWAGGPVSALMMWLGRNNPDSHTYRAGKRLVTSLPVFLSFAITQGIVPLLFLQLMYGPAYYTSSVLMAWPWLAVLAILLMGYYSYYIFKLKGDTMGAKGHALLWGSFVLFGTIAFFFVNNMTLMLTPEKWPAMAAGGVDGLALNLSEPQVIPRYLHFLIGAFAVTGLALGTFGIYYDHKDKPFSQALIRTGAGIYTGFTLVEIFSGAWFLFALPQTMRMAYMGQDLVGTAAFGVSFALTLVSLLSGVLAWRSGGLLAMQVTLGAGLLVTLGMVVMRHLLRVMALHPILQPENIPVRTQWDLLIAFVISAVGLVGYLIWLSRLVYRAFGIPERDHILAEGASAS